MTNKTVERLRELAGIIDRGGSITCYPDGTVPGVGAENTFRDAADEIEYLYSQLDRIRAILGSEA